MRELLKKLEENGFKIMTKEGFSNKFFIIAKNDKSGNISFDDDTNSVRLSDRGNYNSLAFDLSKVNTNLYDGVLGSILDGFSKIKTGSKFYLSDYKKEEIESYQGNLNLNFIYDYILDNLKIDFKGLPINWTKPITYSSKEYLKATITDNVNYNGVEYCGTLFNKALKEVSCYLNITLFPSDTDNCLICNVNCGVSYAHTDGGTNGCDLFHATTKDNGITWEIRGE